MTTSLETPSTVAARNAYYAEAVTAQKAEAALPGKHHTIQWHIEQIVRKHNEH